MSLLSLLHEREGETQDRLPHKVVSDTVVVHAVGENTLVGLAVKDGDREPVYLPVGHLGGGNLDAGTLNHWILDNLRGKTIVGWDCKSISHKLMAFGIDTNDLDIKWNEVQFKGALDNSQRKNPSLYGLCVDLDIKYEQQIDRKSAYEYIEHTHATSVAPHARQDAGIVSVLNDAIKLPDKSEVVLDLENELVPAFIGMERAGVKIDEELLDQWLVETEKEERNLQSRMNAAIGRQCNVNNVDDLRALFHVGGLRLPGAAKPGKLSFARRAIETIKEPMVQEILDLRAITHLRSHYLLEYKKRLRDGFLYPKHHQMKGNWNKTGSSISLLMGDEGTKGMVTGLVSVTDPPITQAFRPSKQAELMGARWIVRKLFIPERGHWFSSDANQIEFKIFAWQTREQLLINAMNAGTDPYEWIGKRCGLPRPHAKLTTLLCLYGGGEDKLAETLNVSLDESRDILEKYHSGFPQSRRSARFWQRIARREGHIESNLGRRRHYDKGARLYTALNSLIQMTRADVIKMKLYFLSTVAKEMGVVVRFISGDEICGDLEDPSSFAELKGTFDAQDTDLGVDITWKTKAGPNWCDLKEAKPS